MADTNVTWESIREGANDVERLIGQKQYNLAMIKSRQTLEVMVKALADSYGINAGDLRSTIDELCAANILSRTSAEHYHKIRIIGNRAAHDGDDNPTGANVAYHMLSQELYTFAHDYGNPKAMRRTRQASSERNREEYNPVRRKKSKRPAHIKETVFIVIAIILAVLLIIGIVKLIGNTVKGTEETEPETEMQIAFETSAPVPETVAGIETEAPAEPKKQYIVNADTVNIREAPNTNCKILVQFHRGDTVDYIEDYDADWAKIDLNGTEAYINRQYITTADESEAMPEGAEQ